MSNLSALDDQIRENSFFLLRHLHYEDMCSHILSHIHVCMSDQIIMVSEYIVLMGLVQYSAFLF